jgi:hypothetical protein
VLIVYGTHNINPQGLYKKYYMMTNELLINKKAKWNNYKYVNGSRLTFSDNKLLNEIKRYKLNEEHGQAIFRSGAHVKEKKIVIVFGFVPDGVENILDYRNFKTTKGAKISISKRLKKFNN